MADHETTDWYNVLPSSLILVTLVTMIICGFGITRYLRKTEVAHTNEGVQTDPPGDLGGRGEPRASSSELVTLG